MTHQTQRYRVNGLDMNVLIAGEGPAVLLVHGFPDTHTVWRKQLAALVAAGYRVIAPDTRGCGETQMSAGVASYRMENLVADLEALLDVLGVRTVRLVAHDWGAMICWHFVSAHPGRVDRYIALSVGHPRAYASGGFMQTIKGYCIALMQLPGVPEFVLPRCNWWALRLMTAYPQEFSHWRASLSRPGRLTACINYYRANLGLVLGRVQPSPAAPIEVPVFGIWSSGDRFISERQMTGSQHFVAGPWHYRRVEGANHWLQLSAPGAVNSLLLEFLG